MSKDRSPQAQLLQGLTWLETTLQVYQKNKQQKQRTLALKQKGCDPNPANEI